MNSVLMAGTMSAASAAQMAVHPLEWGILAVVVIGLLGFDLVSHVRKPHEPSMKESAGWLGFYVALALVLGLYLMWQHAPEFGVQFYSSYFTELSLSVDNIFVFIIIMGSFAVPRKYEQKVLFWGIIIALLLRLVFILAGAALIARFSWVFFIFAAFLIYTAIKQAREGTGEEEETEETTHNENGFVKLVRRFYPVADHFTDDSARTLNPTTGRKELTPYILCIMAIGGADLMFALDSIPASFGLTQQPLIIFAANAFALMGLRQMFFLVDGLLNRLVYLHYGLAVILGFIGLKLVVEACHAYGWLTVIPAFSPLSSLAVIMVVLVMTVVASWLKQRSTEE